MADEKLHLDFESRSTLPFGKGKGVSIYQYSRHTNTDILLASYAFGHERIERWNQGQKVSNRICDHIEAGGIVAAHNALFEYLMWNNNLAPRYGLPLLKFEQMDCTAVRAAVLALPRSLDGAAKALKVDIRKDAEGAKVMLKMSKPRRPRKDEDPTVIWWWDTPQLRARLGDYCDNDVEVERVIDDVLPPLSEQEWLNWQADFRCNMTGVQVDTDFAQRAIDVMDVVSRRYQDELREITHGRVQSVTELAGIKAYLEECNVFTDSLDKNAVSALLDDDGLAPGPRRVLEIRQEAGKSSVAKYQRYLQLTSEDGRMRENFLFHGANTGRDAGKGAQLQNLPSRTGMKWYQAEDVIQMIKETEDAEWAATRVELMWGHIPDALSSCLRGTLTAAPGKQIYCADFSNIEGRVAAWLGDERWKLKAFREFDTFLLDANGNRIPDGDDFKRKGPDLYKVTAGMITGNAPDQVNKVERQGLGKVPELALQFEGGVNAFQSMAKIYGVNMAEHWPNIRKVLQRSIVDKAIQNYSSYGKRSDLDPDTWMASEAVKLAWRSKHPGIVKCWSDAHSAAVNALMQPGKWFKFAGGRLAFGAKEIGGVMFLISRLPNGRRTYRANAKLKPKKNGRGFEVHFWGVDGVTKAWVPMQTYGGDEFQTFVQAIARDVMVNGWHNVQQADYEVILRVHDELAAESYAGRDIREYEDLMCTLPDWAKGLPVSAIGYVSDRYKKD